MENGLKTLRCKLPRSLNAPQHFLWREKKEIEQFLKFILVKQRDNLSLPMALLTTKSRQCGFRKLAKNVNNAVLVRLRVLTVHPPCCSTIGGDDGRDPVAKTIRGVWWWLWGRDGWWWRQWRYSQRDEMNGYIASRSTCSRSVFYNCPARSFGCVQLEFSPKTTTIVDLRVSESNSCYLLRDVADFTHLNTSASHYYPEKWDGERSPQEKLHYIPTYCSPGPGPPSISLQAYKCTIVVHGWRMSCQWEERTHHS